MKKYVLKVEKLVKTYKINSPSPVLALRGVDFTCKEGGSRFNVRTCQAHAPLTATITDSRRPFSLPS